MQPIQRRQGTAWPAGWFAGYGRPDRPAAAGTWTYLPLVLLAALLLRVLVAFSSNSMAHPDEMFQYLEQAHRLAFGHGLVPWEYTYGIRSWLIPGFIAAILSLFDQAGLRGPDYYIRGVEVAFCVISLSLPYFVYRVGQAVFDESAARLALLLAAFWYELVYFAHKPMPDVLGVYALFATIALLFAKPGRTAALGFGLFAALTVAIRFQFLPMIGVLLLVHLACHRRSAAYSLAAFCLAVVAIGLLDHYSWDYFLSSIILNLELNFLQNVSEIFGVRRFYFYGAAIVLLSGGIAVLGTLGLVMNRRRAWPLILVAATGLLAFHVPAHKETRFVLWFTPFYLLGFAHVLDRACRLVPPAGRVRLRSAGLAALAAWPLTVSGLGLATALPYQEKLHGDRLLADVDSRRAYLWLSRQDDVAAVVDESRTPWWVSGGYYTLHHDVPLYFAGLHRAEIDAIHDKAPEFASHWLTRANPPPDGFDLVKRLDAVRIWRRRETPPTTKILPGFGYDMPPPAGLAGIEPKVTPRWSPPPGSGPAR